MNTEIPSGVQIGRRFEYPGWWWGLLEKPGVGDEETFPPRVWVPGAMPLNGSLSVVVPVATTARIEIAGESAAPLTKGPENSK